MSGSILDMGARELARAMARGDLSPVEVVDTHIAHIEACNPILNAVVATRFEAARAEAKAHPAPNWAADRLAAMTPPGHVAIIHVTLTDDHPWAQAFVVIEAIDG